VNTNAFSKRDAKQNVTGFNDRPSVDSLDLDLSIDKRRNQPEFFTGAEPAGNRQSSDRGTPAALKTVALKS
jgi:hypothetical protein